MSCIAHFQITDYDGHTHCYYRFGGGHPKEREGVFGNFPRGNHNFQMETFVRRLDLEKSAGNYIKEISYVMDLKSRHIEISSGVYDGIDFCGTFEEAIRHFVDESYSEKDSLESFAKRRHIEPILSPGLSDGIWTIVDAIQKEIEYLKFDLNTFTLLLIGDNVNFYMYQDCI